MFVLPRLTLIFDGRLSNLHATTLLTHWIQYSMYGHVAKLAEAEKAGIEAAGGTATVYQ